VGSGNDYAAQVSPPITTAEGSFDSVTGVTSESGNVYSADDRCDLKHSNVPNAFSLQLNTNRFTNSSNNVPACNGAASPAGCAGVQQFVFDNQGCLDPSGNPKPCLFIYYFLLDYGKACPTGWTQPPGNSGEIDCTNNSDYAAPIPVQNIADLAKLNLTGRAEGGMDTVTLQTASDDVYALQADSVFNLAQNWQYAEFNVFGTGCGSQANFNIGATIVVRTSVFNGTMSGPTCARGITAETNNLDLLPPCCSIGGTSPAIKFKESNALGVTSTCQCQAVEEGCLGSGDCCSGNCILGTCHCSPLFTGACSTVDDCCGNKSAVECKNGICAPFTGPPTCGGHPHPPQPCSLGWRCCDDNVWTCGLCQ